MRIAPTLGNAIPALRAWPKKILLVPCLMLGLAAFGQANAQNQQETAAPEADQAEVHLGRGYEALKQERYADAAKEFRMALKIDPTIVMRARFPLAIALFEDHKGAESRRELETVRQAVGEQPSICYYFGRLDLEEQKYKSAVANMNKAIANPPFQDTAFYLGFAYFKDGNDQDAEKWLKEALAVRTILALSTNSPFSFGSRAANRKPSRHFREQKNSASAATNSVNSNGIAPEN
jgi:Tfp pilus assembly protein PilF